jgi:hypothetical protein
MHNRARRFNHGFGWASFWNMIGALYLERNNYEHRATIAIDGGVYVIPGRTSAHRTIVLQDQKFIQAFTNDYIFFGKIGPLNADDDNFITRWYDGHGWKISFQDCEDARLETTIGTYPKFLSQCLRWARTTWRSNPTVLLTERGMWMRHPWCIYAVYLTSFINFALFYDAALLYTLYKCDFGDAKTMVLLWGWILFHKLYKVLPYFSRYPEDLIYLPAYIAFIYCHSLIKLWAGVTFYELAWGSRVLEDHGAGDGRETFPNRTSTSCGGSGASLHPNISTGPRCRKLGGDSTIIDVEVGEGDAHPADVARVGAFATDKRDW